MLLNIFFPISPSDLEADLEDNQDYDSTVSHSETNLTLIGRSESYEASQGLPGRQSAISGLSGLNKKVGVTGLNVGSSKYSPESRNVFRPGPGISSPNMASSGADSPSRPSHSSTSSSSPFLSRQRESDSPRSLSGSNSSNVFSYGNASSRSTNNSNNTTSSNTSASRNPDPDSSRNNNTTSNTAGVLSSASDTHYTTNSPPGSASTYRESGNARRDRSLNLSGHLPISQRFRDNDRSGGSGTGYSRVASYQSPRPFGQSSALPTAALQQQNEQQVIQLEKVTHILIIIIVFTDVNVQIEYSIVNFTAPASF